MSYIRKQKVDGKVYLVEVESYWEDGRAKRRQIRFIGAEMPDSGIKAAIWSSLHTLGHIAIRQDDPLLKSISDLEGKIDKLPCHLIPAGKARNGVPQKWCRTHQQYFGRKNDVHDCSHADYPMENELNPMQLDPRLYPGQLAIWYALPPVICTRPAGSSEATGIHIHGRVNPNGKKSLDKTFPCLVIAVPGSLKLSFDWLVVTPPAAEAYLYAVEMGIPMVNESCRHCATPHLDLGYFAQSPHKRHLCGNCGRMFAATSQNISNPLSSVNQMLGGNDEPSILAPRALELNSADYPGGIEIWASTPAIVWKADRPQQTGIHVHAYDVDDDRVIDETYGAVVLDGVELDRSDLIATMLHRYMKPRSGSMFTAHPSDMSSVLAGTQTIG